MTTYSPDGSVIAAGSGGTLVTSAGTWSFSGQTILLNGQGTSGYGEKLEVAEGGQAFAENGGKWWEWSGSGWNRLVGGPVDPLPGPAADGTVLQASDGGVLVTGAGVWGFGSGGAILLDGRTTGGVASELEVANQGRVYAENGSRWWEWNGSGWIGSAAPSPPTQSAPPPADPPPSTVLTVGPGQQYATLAAAVAAAHAGDTIDVMAGTYTNDFAQITKALTIQGVGGMAVFEATENIPNGKAILVTDADVTINNIAFTGARVSDGNGAGIRYESGNLTLNNDYFHANQEGLLAAQNPGGNLTINSSEFASNGTGDGHTHNLYIGGEINSLTINGSYFHDAVVGHEIKSRALNTYIYNSRIFDLSGPASYTIDLPNGGNVVLQNDVIQQGANSQNPTMIAYGEEGSLYPGGSLLLKDDTLVNNLTAHVPLGLWNATGATAQFENTQIYGLTPAQLVSGPNTQVNDAFLSSPPTLDTSHPWVASA